MYTTWVGIQDNNLSLIYASDSLSKVAIKTPVGLTQRVDILKTVNQGEVLSPLKATISVDSIKREQMENLDEHLYRYQGEVAIHAQNHDKLKKVTIRPGKMF